MSNHSIMSTNSNPSIILSSSELSYETIATVLDTWEDLRAVPNYEEVAGVVLFSRLFQVAPDAKKLFGYSATTNFDNDDLWESKRFRKHGASMIQMLDTAMNMLGPDQDTLHEIWKELGQKHRRFGVRSDFFSAMGDALIYALRDILGKQKFSIKAERAMIETYHYLSDEMSTSSFRKRS